MLIGNDLITVKQTLFLLIGKGFYKCEIWYNRDYFIRHELPKRILRSLISSKYMDILISNGIPTWKARQLVILNGYPSLSKKNLKLLAKPIITGSVEEVSNHMELWNRKVTSIRIHGFFRNKIAILLENDDKINISF